MKVFRITLYSLIILLVAACQSAATHTNPPEPVVTESATEAAVLADLESRIRNNAAESLLFFNEPERLVAFKNIDKLYPTRLVKAGNTPFALGAKPVDLSGLVYQLDGQAFTLADFTGMAANRGLLVVLDGNVLFEHYAEGHSRNTKWISFSVTKSVTSMLIGAAIQDGYIKSVDEPVVHYLPRLRGTGYDGATIRNILHMSSGVAWNEDYADPNSDVAKAGGANGLELVTYLGGLAARHPRGEVFNYNTGETNLVGEILRAAIGNNAATYLTHKIWQPFGMEADATWLTGGEGGGETGGCCISATLRDYARIGLFAMNNGQLPDGSNVLPEGWMTESTTPSKGASYYGYLWWLGDGAFQAQGIFGQWIFVDPTKNLVIALHSNAPTAVGSQYARHLSAVVEGIRAAL